MEYKLKRTATICKRQLQITIIVYEIEVFVLFLRYTLSTTKIRSRCIIFTISSLLTIKVTRLYLGLMSIMFGSSLLTVVCRRVHVLFVFVCRRVHVLFLFVCA